MTEEHVRIVAVQKPGGDDHLAVQQNVLGKQAQKVAFVAVRAVEHRSDGKSSVKVDVHGRKNRILRLFVWRAFDRLIVVPKNDFVSTVFFSEVQSLVGKLDAAFRSELDVVLRNAERNGHLDFLVAKEYGLVLDLPAEAFGDEGCVFQFRFGEERQELFATVTGEDIVLAEEAADGARYGLEHGIACGMAVGVVDVLEMVDVDENHAERPPHAVCAFHFSLDGPVHVATVRQLSQFVRS